MSDDDDKVIHVNFGAPVAPEPEPEPEPVPDANYGKLRRFTEMVDEGTVLVTLDARRDGVVVPPQFSREMRLNLNFCYGFGIPDFDFDDYGVRASLSFGGVDFYCDVPWPAVYMFRSHVHNDAVLFPEDVPPEMLAAAFGDAGGEEE